MNLLQFSQAIFGMTSFMAKSFLVAMKLDFVVANLAAHKVQQNLFGFGRCERAANQLNTLSVVFGHNFQGLQ